MQKIIYAVEYPGDSIEQDLTSWKLIVNGPEGRQWLIKHEFMSSY